MKISVLTPTYNREKLIKKLYNSLIENSKYEVDIEWIIMDDGSTDETEKIINDFIKEDKIKIIYQKQENQGKMVAINNMIKKATGDIIIDCDSDDYFTQDAFKIIKEEYEKYQKNKNEKIKNEKIKSEDNIYGICFLKYDQNGNNMGNEFKNKKTKMFDLYFKEGETGEKSIAFIGSVRKKYEHKLEKKERFITEARMYHKMDEKYNLICINKPIMICEYQEEGYSKNIKKQFLENPYGYYEYFKEILEKDFKDVKFSKRMYAIKQYILFSYLTKTYKIKNIKNGINKFLYILLFVPGIIKSFLYDPFWDAPKKDH